MESFGSGRLSARAGFNVQDYKEKRAAQLERAKKLREERMVKPQRTEEQPGPVNSNRISHGSQPNPPHKLDSKLVETPVSCRSDGSGSGVSYGHPDAASLNLTPHVLASSYPSQEPPKAVARSTSSDVLVEVTENSLLRAASEGIITFDQCNRLWTFFSTELPSKLTPFQPMQSSASSLASQKAPIDMSQPPAKPPAPYTVANPISMPSSSSSENYYENQMPSYSNAKLGSASKREKGPRRPEWNMDTNILYQDPQPISASSTGSSATQQCVKTAKEPARNGTARRVEAKSDSTAYDTIATIAPKRESFNNTSDLVGSSDQYSEKKPLYPNGGRSTRVAPPSRLPSGYSGSSGEPKSSYETPYQVSSAINIDNIPIRKRQQEVPHEEYYAQDIIEHEEQIQQVRDKNSFIEVDSFAASNIPMTKCDQCGRSFRIDRIDKHTSVCGAVFGSKRKAFNIKEHRVPDEAVNLSRPGSNKQPHNSKNAKRVGEGNEKSLRAVPKWKLQHIEFQNACRAGRGQKPMSLGAAFDVPHTGSNQFISTDDRVECPHCSRKYSSDVAERHIPKCKNVINKPKSLHRKF